jgi:hypothetical protein
MTKLKYTPNPRWRHSALASKCGALVVIRDKENGEVI